MIDSFHFGRIVVDGVAYGGDIKIVEGRVVSDWWRRSGHRVEVDDVRDILAASPEVLVIGRGQPGLMKVSADLRRRLKEKGVEVIEERTSRAVDTFNRLSASGRRVAAGFHVSC